MNSVPRRSLLPSADAPATSITSSLLSDVSHSFERENPTSDSLSTLLRSGERTHYSLRCVSPARRSTYCISSIPPTQPLQKGQMCSNHSIDPNGSDFRVPARLSGEKEWLRVLRRQQDERAQVRTCTCYLYSTAVGRNRVLSRPNSSNKATIVSKASVTHPCLSRCSAFCVTRAVCTSFTCRCGRVWDVRWDGRTRQSLSLQGRCSDPSRLPLSLNDR